MSPFFSPSWARPPAILAARSRSSIQLIETESSTVLIAGASPCFSTVCSRARIRFSALIGFAGPPDT